MINKNDLLNICLTTNYSYYPLIVSDCVVLKKHIMPTILPSDLFIGRYDTKNDRYIVIYKTIYQAKLVRYIW